MTEREELGGFERREKIGSGGMATVHLALQKALDRLVVLKIMHPHLAENESLVTRFMREARAAAALKHPNIVQVIDCGQKGAKFYIAMEFVEGRDLSQILEAHGTPPLEVAILLLRDICRGLEHAHERGFVHRDIKPSNFMLPSEGVVKIMDFGLARQVEDVATVTAAGSVLGTPAYMSPEQAKGEAVDARTDIFSLGIVGYELFSGNRPFQGDSLPSLIQAVTQSDPPPLSDPPVPVALAELIQRMLVKDPGGRCPSANVVRKVLESVMESMGLTRAQDLLREYARDPDGCGRRLRQARFDSEAVGTIVRTPDTPAPDPSDADGSAGIPPGTLAGGGEPPMGEDKPPSGDAEPPPPPPDPGREEKPKGPKRAPILVGAIVVVVAAFLLYILQPWRDRDGEPQGHVQPTELDIGTVLVETRVAAAFTITNTGDENLSGRVSVTCDPIEILSGGGDYDLRAGESVEVNLLFTPPQAGDYECVVETGNPECEDVSIRGRGELGPSARVLPDTLDFGPVLVGTRATHAFTITNVGGQTVSGAATAMCEHFTIISGEGAYDLGANESVEIVVQFAPPGSGPYECSIETGIPGFGDVIATGQGDREPECRVHPVVLDFGSVSEGASETASFSIKNVGGQTLTGTIAETCDYFTISSGSGNYSLGPDETVRVRVRFTPPGAGSYSCTIDAGTRGCRSVSCAGRGTESVGPVVESKEYLVFAAPSGRVFYENQCVSEQGYSVIVKLKPGTNSLRVIPFSRPEDAVTFEYTVVADDPNNKLILHLDTGEVEPGITNLDEHR